MGGNQNALRVQSEIPASSAFISQACNQRKTLGSPESNVGARTGIHWALHMPATVLSHLQALFNRFLLLGDVASDITQILYKPQRSEEICAGLPCKYVEPRSSS